MAADLQTRTIMITGANTGIGRAAATELARRGARVILACRSEAKTRPVVDAIQRETGNPAVDFLPLDLSDLDAVRRSAERWLKAGTPLHVLINNAGVAGQRGLTKDGFELAFGVNHLGHFLFTQLLLERVCASTPARIVTVASAAHRQASGIDFDALRRPTSFTGLKEYAVSKLCNVLFTQELARRLDGTGVTTYAVHPGVIASDIWRRLPSPLRALYTRIAGMKSTAQGARPLLHCATAPELAHDTGRYYHECEERTPNRIATPELARDLWDRSAAWAARS